MLKGLGIIFVFFTISMIGQYMALRIKNEIASEKRLLNIIIDSRIYILSERRHAARLKEKIEAALCNVTDSDIKLPVTELLSKLGSTPAEGQALLFSGCEQRLSALIEAYEAKGSVRQKLCASLGILAGAMVAVILV